MATATGANRNQGSIAAALQKLLGGLILLMVGFSLLLWNELRIVQRYQRDMQVYLEVRSTPADTLRGSLHGELVHTAGRLQTPDTLTDPVFGLSAQAVRLRREVEIYDGERFQPADAPGVPRGHQPITPWSATAATVNLGSFALSQELVREMDFFQRTLPRQLQLPEGAQIRGDHVFIGEDPDRPQDSDMRIFFELLPETEVSVIALQDQTRLTGQWRDADGYHFYLVREGVHDVSDLLPPPAFRPSILEWLFRVLGLILTIPGCHLLLMTARSLSGSQPMTAAILGRNFPFRAAGVTAVFFAGPGLALPWMFVHPYRSAAIILLAMILLAAYGVTVVLSLRSQSSGLTSS